MVPMRTPFHIDEEADYAGRWWRWSAPGL